MGVWDLRSFNGACCLWLGFCSDFMLMFRPEAEGFKPVALLL